MIIIFLGDIGSGKSLSVVKDIIDCKQFAYTNFKLKHMQGKYHRLKWTDIFKKEVKELNNKQKEVFDVNWEFWDSLKKKHKSYSVYLDEVHNLIHARRAMTKQNIVLSKWLSQIRKILGDSPTNHLVLISQTLRRIDVDARELAQMFIECEAVKLKSGLFVIQKYYRRFEGTELVGKPLMKKGFKADRYFKFYDSLETIRYKDMEEYV